MNAKLNDALYNYLMDPKNPLYNFTLGKVYEDEGHTAAAASFYIRTGEFATEYDNNNLLTYEALLRLALCFEHQGSRVFTVKGILLRAISLMPERPEAYFLLSRMYEMCREWQEGYTIAVIGKNIPEPEEKLITNVEYPGKYGFLFEQGVTGWWLGLWDESINIFRKLRKNPEMKWEHTAAVNNNLINLEGQTLWKSPITYWKANHEHLRYKFPESHTIERNYSQCYQDMFVLTMLQGKKQGTFLEIGGADPYYGNNTALLEKQFGWTGISIDYDQNLVNAYSNARPTRTLCADATKVDYRELLKDYKDIDYLQIDCDPAMATYNTLLRIPFDEHRFAVITFEHDVYVDDKSNVKEKAIKYLQSLGYEQVVNNISPDDHNAYEDWWVHPDLVSRYMINIMKDLSDKPKRADKYMYARV